MTIDSERDMFERKLQELYRLERELEDAQARLADEAVDERLEEFFMGHRRDTEDQIGRLEELFDAVNAEPEDRPETVLQDLLAERRAYLTDTTHRDSQDLLDAEVARAIERLEITLLETLLELGDRLDLPPDAIEPLRESKREAENALETLGPASA